MTQTAATSELSFTTSFMKQLSGRPVRLGKDYVPPPTVPAVQVKHRFTPSSGQSSTSVVPDAPGTLDVTFTVKPLKGSGGEHIVSLPPTATIAFLKNKLEPITGLASKDQRLIIKGKALQDVNTLAAYSVENGNVVHILAKPGAVQTIPLRTTVGTTSPVENVSTVRSWASEPKFWMDLGEFLRERVGGQVEANQVLKEFMNVYKQYLGGLKPQDLDRFSSV